jgi:hypothetical protein
LLDVHLAQGKQNLTPLYCSSARNARANSPMIHSTVSCGALRFAGRASQQVMFGSPFSSDVSPANWPRLKAYFIDLGLFFSSPAYVEP